MSQPIPSLSAQDIQRLRDEYLGSFRESKKSRRTEVVKEAFKDLLQTREGQLSQGSRSMFKQTVKEWLYNHGRKRFTNDRVKYLRKWTLTRVVGHVRKNEVDEACRKRSGEASGATTYLANYQKVLKGIVQALPDDERDHYEQQALEWNQRSPPVEMQRKTAEQRGGQYVKEFARQMYRQLGMRVFVLSAHTDTKGELCISSHDFNDLLEGDAFGNICPDWETGDIMEEWGKYVRTQLDPDHEHEETRLTARRGRKKPLVELDTDEDRLPLLPDPDDGGGLELRDMAPIVRSYITCYYKVASGVNAVSVPWGCILEQTDLFIRQEYLPEGTKLREPSKLSKAAAYSLLKFWYGRQEDPKCKIPFSFFAVKNAKDGEIVPVDDIRKTSRRGTAEKKGAPAADADSDSESQHEGRDTSTSNSAVGNRRPAAKRAQKIVRELPFSASRRDPITGQTAPKSKPPKRRQDDTGSSAKRRKIEGNKKAAASGKAKEKQPSAKRPTRKAAPTPGKPGKDGVPGPRRSTRNQTQTSAKRR